MCGILGVVTSAGRSPSLDDRAVEAARDRLAHRGPDGAGLWRYENIVLAHRRLAVLDTSVAGHQPMLSRDGRSAMVYNGELYNDREIRDELGASGVTFRSRSDAETVLESMRRWGEAAIAKLRGMYALAYVDVNAQTLLLARDALGIKPLYYALVDIPGGNELIFASELSAILAHPCIAARPDAVTISSYLTTIRTTLGSRTLFAGVQSLGPGEAVTVDLRRGRLVVGPRRWWQGAMESSARVDGQADSLTEPTDQELRAAVEDSIVRHLRADVPACCLLSGGLDSTIITLHAARHCSGGALRTYSSGSPGGAVEATDLDISRRVAERLGTIHAEAPVSREMFAQRWPEMVERLGLPLSTPNEVAINALARLLRADGQIVALSGEGADEMFGGYEIPLTRAAEHIAGCSGASEGDWRERGGLFQTEAAAWVSTGAKASILNEQAMRLCEHDDHLREEYGATFRRISGEADRPSPLETHLRFTREVNLTGLLLRLDQATMLEGVEGRTPFADQRIAAMAGRLSMDRKFVRGDASPGEGRSRAAQTKIALRRAFGADLPSSVLARPKASFPLPFQEWLEDNAHAVRRSSLVRELFTPQAITAVAHTPGRVWPAAWPMINIALWSRRWWG